MGRIFFTKNSYHYFFSSIQRAYETLNQNQVNFKYTQVIHSEVKLPRSHLMEQRMQIFDILVNKYKSFIIF